MTTNVLNYLRISEGIPRRISNKWLYVLKTCWYNLFDNKLSISHCKFYLEDNDKGMIISLLLPPVSNKECHFKNDIFMISLLLSNINYDINLKKFLEKEIYNIEFSIIVIENNLFKIIIKKSNETINIFTNDIMISSLYKKENEIFGLVY